MTPPATTRAPAAFVTTQWTRVLEARGDSPEAQAALSDLCATYYAPVIEFIRRSGYDENSAKDLAHEFFARLLANQGINTVQRERGRFRSFLLGAVKHFLSDMRKHQRRLKRGAGHTHEPLLPETDTSPGLELTDTNAPSPDREFDRKWALTVLEQALASLVTAHQAEGKAEFFETLKPWLTGDTDAISQAKAALQLGMNEGAVKVAIHRLRRRFREAIKAAIAQTLTDPGQLDEEWQHLLEALG